jgi:nucleoside-diphosphate-sugar epimerase
MRVLIVGGNSLVASALKPVIKESSEIITAGRANCDIYLDLNDPIENIVFKEKYDTVIHLAAAFKGKTVAQIMETEYVNVLGTLKLCKAALEAGIEHFVLISSIYAQLPYISSFYSAYSMSKKHSEDMAQLFCNTYKLPLTILQPTQLYGDSDEFRLHQPFLYFIADKAQKNEDIFIYGSHDPKRNFLHVNDFAKILTNVVKYQAIGTFQCTNLVDVSFVQIAQAAISAFQSNSKIFFEADKANIPDNIFEHDHSLYKIINYQPTINIEEGMRRIAHHRKQK